MFARLFKGSFDSYLMLIIVINQTISLWVAKTYLFKWHTLLFHPMCWVLQHYTVQKDLKSHAPCRLGLVLYSESELLKTPHQTVKIQKKKKLKWQMLKFLSILWTWILTNVIISVCWNNKLYLAGIGWFNSM